MASKFDCPCPECRAPSRGTQTSRTTAGVLVRFRKCDNGHTFNIKGEADLRPTPKKPRKKQPLYEGPLRTEWRFDPWNMPVIV